MKKINKFLSIFALAAVLFTSCEVGLGPAVDMEPPVVTLTSHKDNDSVASTFRLVGTASDNEGVTKLKVDFEDKNIHFYVTGDGIWHKKTASSEWVIVDSEKASVQYIIDGKQSMTVFKDTRTLAADSVAMAVSLLEGKEPVTDTTYDNNKNSNA